MFSIMFCLPNIWYMLLMSKYGQLFFENNVCMSTNIFVAFLFSEYQLLSINKCGSFSVGFVFYIHVVLIHVILTSAFRLT